MYKFQYKIFILNFLTRENVKICMIEKPYNQWQSLLIQI